MNKMTTNTLNLVGSFVPIADYEKKMASSRFTDFLKDVEEMTKEEDIELNIILENQNREDPLSQPQTSHPAISSFESKEKQNESPNREQDMPIEAARDFGEESQINLNPNLSRTAKQRRTEFIENEYNLDKSRHIIGVKWSGDRHDNLLEDHIKKRNSTVLPFVKKFMFRLKNASPYRSVSNLREESFVLLNDKSYFYEEMKKEDEIYNAEKVLKNWLIFLRKIDSTFYNIKMTGLYRLFTIFGSTYFQTLHPYGNFKIVWDIVHLFLVIFWIFYIPLLISFENVLEIDFEGTSYALIFLSEDIFFHCNTSYFKSGLEEKKRKKIIINYVKKSFLRDVLCIIPFIIDYFIFKKPHVFSFNIGGLEIHNALEVNEIHFLKLLFYLKISTVNETFNRILEKFLLKEKFQNMVALFRIFFISIVVAHCFACFFYFTANLQTSYTYETWLSFYGLQNADWKKQYLYSIYWSLITMMTVGYGDISPKNEYETLIAMIVVVFGCGVYAYNINSVGMILQDLNKRGQEFTRNINIISQFMKRKKINKDLQMRVREYLRFIWQEENTQNIEQEQKILNSLSNSLKEELLVEAYGTILKDHPMFFANFSESSLRKVVSIIKDIKLIPDETVFLQNEQTDFNIYFIMKGKIELFFRNNTKQEVFIKRLKIGDHFGEIGFFSGQGRTLSVRSKDFTTLLTINREEFLQILERNPEDFQKFRMIQDQIILYDDIHPLKIRCISCSQTGHIASKCPLIHFLPDKEKVIKKFNFYVDQERQLFSRKRSDRFNTRINKVLIEDEAIQLNKDLLKLKRIEKKEQFKKLKSMFQSVQDESFSEDTLLDSATVVSSESEEEEDEKEGGDGIKEETDSESCVSDADDNKISKNPEGSSFRNLTVSNPKLKRNSAFVHSITREKKGKKYHTSVSIHAENRKKTVVLENTKIQPIIQSHQSHQVLQPKKKEIPRVSILSTAGEKNDIKSVVMSLASNFGGTSLHNPDLNEKNVKEIIKNVESFEVVRNFKNYFAHNNIKYILECISQSPPQFLKYSKSLYERKKSVDHRLSKYTFFPEEMKGKMPAAIKRKALRNSAAMLSKRSAFLTRFSNFENDPDSKNHANNESSKKRLSTDDFRRGSVLKVGNFCDLVSLLINNPSLKKKVRKGKKNSFLS